MGSHFVEIYTPFIFGNRQDDEDFHPRIEAIGKNRSIIEDELDELDQLGIIVIDFVPFIENGEDNNTFPYLLCVIPQQDVSLFKDHLLCSKTPIFITVYHSANDKNDYIEYQNGSENQKKDQPHEPLFFHPEFQNLFFDFLHEEFDDRFKIVEIFIHQNDNTCFDFIIEAYKDTLAGYEPEI